MGFRVDLQSLGDRRDMFERLIAEWAVRPAALASALIEAKALLGTLAPCAIEHVAWSFRLSLARVEAVVQSSVLLRDESPMGSLHVCANAACAAREPEFIAAVDSNPPGKVVAASCAARCDAAPVAWRNGEEPRRLSVIGYVAGTVPTSHAAPAVRVGRTVTSVTTRNVHRRGAHQIAVYQKHGGYIALTRLLADERPDALVAAVLESGLVGCGGAGFLAGEQWAAVRAAPGERKFVVVNAAEGEPGSFKDRALLERDPHGVIEGGAIAALAVGARDVFVCLRGSFIVARDRLRRAIAEFGSLSLSRAPQIHLRLVAGGYAAGEDTALIEGLEGRPPRPREKPPYPSEAGLFGKPTLVHNVETVAALPFIVEAGASAYRALGANGSSGTKLFCLSGDIKTPGVFELPRGTPFRELLNRYGGGMRTGRTLKAFLAGGASGAFLPPAAIDVRLDDGSLRDAGALLGTGAFVAVSERSCLVDLALRATRFFADESCGACDACRIGTRDIARLASPDAGAPSETGLGNVGTVARIREIAATMRGASRCGLGRAAPNALLSVLDRFPVDVTLHVSRSCACSRSAASAR